jgi:1-aminocyclopropane-1-carboxylate deaminase/D-cysteine desulfhydrase-like pyridoxal-dependent ACC family enzyme
VELHLRFDDNKARKLKYNLIAAREQGQRTLATFGGAYSHHIRATAIAGRAAGFHTVGIIRGEEHRPLNPVLQTAADHGMRLSYMDRERYRRKEVPDDLGPCYLLPEGGSNEPAVRGCAELGAEIDGFDVVAVPVGTGGTLAGLAAGLKHGVALGFSVLKGGDFLRDRVAELQRRTYGELRGRFRVETAFHCGGYARTTPHLREFLAEFEARQGVRLDPVYTGKMVYGLHQLNLPSGTRVCAIITTG